MDPQQTRWIGQAVTIAIVGLVLVLRFRGLRRARKLRVETLWIVPALLALVLCIMLWEYPPREAATWLWLAVALAIGAGVGWWRGTMMRIAIDPATHRLDTQASPASLLFVVLLIVARQGLRYEAAALGIDILKVTAMLTAFALGLTAAARAEMFVRARRLLAEARQAPSGISTGPTTSR